LLVARLNDLASVETAREAADANARAVTDALLEGLDGRLEVLEQALTTSGYAEESFQDAVRTQLETSLESGDRVLREVDGVRADLAAVREQVAAYADPSAGIGPELDALRADLANALDAVPQLVRDALPGPAEADTSVADNLLEVRTDLATLAAETLAALQALATPPVIPDLSPQLAALSSQMDRIPDPTETLIALRDAVADLPDHGSDLASLRDRVEELATSLGSVSEALPVLQETVTTSDARVGELRDSLALLPSQVEAWRADSDDDRRRLVEALNALDLAREDMASLVEQIRDQGSVAADLVKDASLESLDRVRADTERAIADLRTEIEAARGALDEHVRSIRTQVGEFSREGAAQALEEVRSALTAQAEETNAARAEMDRIAGRVQSAGRLLVAYLGERDVALEEVRDRTTVALLEDVLSGLPRRDREKAAEHARGLLARRREGRQAERWRRLRSDSESTLPAADDAALLELLDAPDPGARASTPASSPVVGAPTPTPTPTPDSPEAPTTSGPDSPPPTPPRPSASPSRRSPSDRATPRKGAQKAPTGAAKKAPTKSPNQAAAKVPTTTATPTPTPTPTTPSPALTPAAKKAPVKAARKAPASAAKKAPARSAPTPRRTPATPVTAPAKKSSGTSTPSRRGGGTGLN
jgi:predicted  nucleic acid-binding Zn-ribbon protein